ncbi:succinylglutamate desuccinylase/aspartoacylase family protein [Paracoccaceae bacterium GXU_MW_L88]
MRDDAPGAGPEVAPFEIAGEHIAPGRRATVNVPVSQLSDHTPVNLAVHVVHGKKPGPTMFVSAAIHGDEIIGVEIVRRLLGVDALEEMAGTLLAVPIVNSYGFMNHSRYLPDRRDLNRVFPGSERGSLASRLAHIFMQEVVLRCEIGIDLHSAAIHRTNLPQIRVSSGNKHLMDLGKVFGAPIVVVSSLREGSLRGEAKERGVDMLLYEAGEGLRFDETAVATGVGGILRVMAHLGMIEEMQERDIDSLIANRSGWTRAPAGGLFRAFAHLGDTVAAGDVLGAISDPFGTAEEEVLADIDGMIIGRANLPIVYEGDALFHIAKLTSEVPDELAEHLAETYAGDRMADEDEII